MRFTSVLISALPFFAGVLAAPTPAPAPGFLGGLGAGAVAKKDIDILGVVTKLHADVIAAGAITPASTELQVQTCLGAVVKAFDTCGNSLGVDLGLSLNVGLVLNNNWWDSHCTNQQCKDSVAEIVADVVIVVDRLVKGIDAKLCKVAAIAKLLLKINTYLCNFLSCLDKVLIGLITLVHALLVKASCTPSYLLQAVLTLLCF